MTKVELYFKYHDLTEKISELEKTIGPIKGERQNVLDDLAKAFGWSEEAQRANTNDALLQQVVFEVGMAELKTRRNK
jgi:hypothetical protein